MKKNHIFNMLYLLIYSFVALFSCSEDSDDHVFYNTDSTFIKGNEIILPTFSVPTVVFANYDDGDIVRQVVVPIEEEECRKQDISKATYFGKRTPADGEIHWDWHKEHIRNWVRAQAKPYPGAFTFIERKAFFHFTNIENLDSTIKLLCWCLLII